MPRSALLALALGLGLGLGAPLPGGDLLGAQLLGGLLALGDLLDAGDRQQVDHSLGGLGPLGEPIARPVGVDLDPRGVGVRVIDADVLDEPSVAWAARIGHHHAVVGRLLHAHAHQADLDCHGVRSLLVRGGPPVPGSMPRTWFSGPIFLTCWSCCRKSSSVKEASRSLRSMRSASWRSTSSSARSISVSMSPMPRMRPARRSGWNGSKSASFSPVVANLMGTPVTERLDSAAPPRASPSSLERITPV